MVTTIKERVQIAREQLRDYKNDLKKLVSRTRIVKRNIKEIERDLKQEIKSLKKSK